MHGDIARGAAAGRPARAAPACVFTREAAMIHPERDEETSR